MKKIELAHVAGQDPYGTALKIALEELGNADMEERCRKAGAVWAPRSPQGGVVDLRCLGRGVRIRFPEGYFEADGEAPPQWERVLLLHYLITASGAPPTGRMITFKQVPGGAFYYPAFARRTTQLLLKNFGGRLEDWLDAAGRLGWGGAPFGDAAVEVEALPMVRVIYVLWKGDEEFPPDGNVLFDENITQYFPVEDIAVLCNMIALKMVREDRK
ncbi:MAG: DUF3786 domain-containing protein [Deltaproteobacteria bacterium]|nr:DUF3786 domain-containing protein [Deltaproteobacteria bacterium]MBW2306054.1 DUF3786 domain-containing protein [Deltaproteobacteria bacterium]